MHSLHAHILKKEDLSSEIEHIDLDVEGLILTAEIPHVKDGTTYIEIDTDYFGGFGEQSCILHEKNTSTDLDNINHGLRMLGVIKKEKMDEFDTVGLGSYRTIKDAFPQKFIHEEFTNDTFAEKERDIIEILALYISDESLIGENAIGSTHEESIKNAENWYNKNKSRFNK